MVKDSARARGSLAVDPKSGEPTHLPERFCAWDEDRTTLAIDAARAIAHASFAFVGAGIDVDTLRVALDLAEVHVAADPMAAAKGAAGPALAIGCPDDHTAIAALVDDGTGPDPAAPREIGAPPRMVSALRALQETRAVPPGEPIHDQPMGAYVPWGTWMEDLPARLRLVAQRCTSCARAIYPPRAACPACMGRVFEPLQLPGEARVYTATRIGKGGAPSEFALEQAQVGAFWVGVVEWPEHGVRVTARLSGYDEDAGGPAIGEPVRALVRRLFEQEGKVRYGTKFTRVP